MKSKLVRDKIPEIIKRDGKIPLTHFADNKEFSGMLNKKLQEEVEEFIKNTSIEKMSDIFEVITAINNFRKWSLEDITAIQKKKREKRGEFRRRVILDGIE